MCNGRACPTAPSGRPCTTPPGCAFSRCSRKRNSPSPSSRKSSISASRASPPHLAHLRRVGLVHPRREGKRTYYSLVKKLDKETRQILDSALLTLSEVPGAKADASGLKLVLEKRRTTAREYFNRVAGRLGKSFCPGRTWTEIGPLLAHLVPHVVVADLGAGEGWLSQLLARRASKVIAVDNSPKMVAFGRNEAKKKGIPNLEYRLGDLAAPPIPARSVDIVTSARRCITSPIHSRPSPPPRNFCTRAAASSSSISTSITSTRRANSTATTGLASASPISANGSPPAGLQQIEIQLLTPESEPPPFPAHASERHRRVAASGSRRRPCAGRRSWSAATAGPAFRRRR